MIEGIPAFFAASRYGAALIVFMAIVFAASTIATYVALCCRATIKVREPVNLDERVSAACDEGRA
jgi:hypothetical protein